MSTFAGRWSELYGSPTTGAGYLARRVPSVGACGVLVALHMPSNRRAILIEVHTAAVPSRLRLPQAGGFEVSVTPLSLGDEGLTQIALHERGPDALNVFAAFADDLINQLELADDEVDAIRRLEERLLRWRRFFSVDSIGSLTVEEQRGLWVELWFLRTTVFAATSPHEAVSAWVGPHSANHDYEFTACSVEIKSSVAGPPVEIRIANALQLQAITGKPLFLFVVLMDSVSGGGMSLVEMVQSVRLALTEFPSAAMLLEDRLLATGYIDAHRERYLSPSFAVRSEHWYLVADGFPRVVEADLRPGVGDVSYAVALGACESFRCESTSVSRLLARAGSG